MVPETKPRRAARTLPGAGKHPRKTSGAADLRGDLSSQRSPIYCPVVFMIRRSLRFAIAPSLIFPPCESRCRKHVTFLFLWSSCHVPSVHSVAFHVPGHSLFLGPTPSCPCPQSRQHRRVCFLDAEAHRHPVGSRPVRSKQRFPGGTPAASPVPKGRHTRSSSVPQHDHRAKC